MLEGVLTGSEYMVSRRELALRYFTCTHCGAAGEVVFGAEGARTQALIPCPTCGRRAPGAARWAGIRIAFWAACGLGMVAVGGAQLVMGAAGCAAMALWQALRERGRFKRAARASILKLEPGTLPAQELRPPRPVVRRQLAPPPDLPRARVITAPAPIVEAAPDPSAPPKFLVDRDEA